MADTKIPVAIVWYDVNSPTDAAMSVGVSETAVGFLSTFTDFELKVFATEASMRVKKALEMPPSPEPRSVPGR